MHMQFFKCFRHIVEYALVSVSENSDSVTHEHDQFHCKITIQQQQTSILQRKVR